MAEAPQSTSIADRIAALKLNQVGRQPSPGNGQPTNGANGRAKPPPPAPPARPSLPERPSLPGRAISSNNPPTQDYAPVSNGGVGNMPEEGRTNAPVAVARPDLPPRTATQSSQGPALPARKPSESPALPSRRPSDLPGIDSRRPSDYSLSRRDSNDSTGSALSRTSTSERMKAPAYDPASLPPLPAKRTAEEKASAYKKYNEKATPWKKGLTPTNSSSTVPQRPAGSTPALPARTEGRAPALPPPGEASRGQTTQATALPALPARSEGRAPSLPPPIEVSRAQMTQSAASPPPTQREIVPPPPKRSALSMGFGNAANTATTEPPPVPTARPGSVPQVDGGLLPPPVPTNRPGSVPQPDAAQPPPVPLGSRPDLSALQASKPKPSGPKVSGVYAASESGSFGSCLLCRDYSGPDNHAARFPRESLPSQDLGWLAQQLTALFPSTTDKARAIFTWLHHNVAYDTVAFFGGNVRPSTPQSTLQTGLAVCEGYAGLFAALAMKAGLEAYVISGHGKGFGYAALAPGSPLPPYSAGHAWNVVKIDGGQWKLIDACWGAGVVNGANRPYEKRFAPERFTQSNEEFGLDHFPGDNSKQFRNDGRVVSWEEYITGNKDGCGAAFFSGYVSEEGLDKTTFKPTDGKIYLSQQPGPTIRFSFQKICPHWDPIRCGRGPYYLYVLHLEALDGTQRNHIPFETNGDVWWCDVPIQDLGQPGMKAQIYAVTKFDGGDGRGLTIQRYRERKGRCAFAFGGVCMWEIA